MIEEAYFVLSDGVMLEDGRDKFLKEANRIIEENSGGRKKREKKLFHFFIGALFGVFVLLSLTFLVRIIF